MLVQSFLVSQKKFFFQVNIFFSIVQKREKFAGPKHSEQKIKIILAKIWSQTRQEIDRVTRMSPECRQGVNILSTQSPD